MKKCFKPPPHVQDPKRHSSHRCTPLHSPHDCQQHTTVSLKEVAGYPIPHPALPELIFPSDSNCVECTFKDHPWRYFTGGLQGSASTKHLDQELDSLFLSTTSWLMDPAEYRRRSRSRSPLSRIPPYKSTHINVQIDQMESGSHRAVFSWGPTSLQQSLQETWNYSGPVPGPACNMKPPQPGSEPRPWNRTGPEEPGCRTVHCQNSPGNKFKIFFTKWCLV